MLAAASVFSAPNALANPGTVVKWETQSYSQSAHVTRNHPVYSVKVGDITYQIARRTTKVEFTVSRRTR